MTAPAVVERLVTPPSRSSSVRVRRHGEVRPTTAGAGTPRSPAASWRCDDHSVVLWQTCAYAAAVIDAERAGQPLETPQYELLHFLRVGQLAEHAGIRGGIEAIETSRTPVQTRQAVEALVADLERRLRSEEPCAADAADAADAAERWALPLLLRDDIDLASLPSAGREALLLTRLQRMRRGEVIRLHAGDDLHPLWRLLRMRTRADHGWVYEQAGPVEWTARITRRGCG